MEREGEVLPVSDLTLEERLARFRATGANLPPGPALPDEALSRDTMYYEGREETDDPGVSAMQRLGDLVEAAGLYDQVYVGDDEG